jgi:dephospho-CoA kinase
LWALVGYPGSGKSTFAAQMRGPLLVIDADHRFDEVARLAAGGVYRLSETPADNVLVDRIDACLRANMPASDVQTIVVDSLTAILAPLVTRAIVDNLAGRNKNKSAAFLDKALAMRLLQDACGMWGVDLLFVYHLQDGRDAHGQAITTATVSRTELARLQRSINLQLRLVQEGDKWGVRVDWARRGRSGLTLWDDSGSWQGMPDRIEQAVYGGLSKEDQERIERATPTSFTGPEQAIAWGFEQGVFQALPHARNAYDKIKAEHKPTCAADMWGLWIADVTARKAARGQPAHY